MTRTARYLIGVLSIAAGLLLLSPLTASGGDVPEWCSPHFKGRDRTIVADQTVVNPYESTLIAGYKAAPTAGGLESAPLVSQTPAQQVVIAGPAGTYFQLWMVPNPDHPSDKCTPTTTTTPETTTTWPTTTTSTLPTTTTLPASSTTTTSTTTTTTTTYSPPSTSSTVVSSSTSTLPPASSTTLTPSSSTTSTVPPSSTSSVPPSSSSTVPGTTSTTPESPTRTPSPTPPTAGSPPRPNDSPPPLPPSTSDCVESRASSSNSNGTTHTETLCSTTYLPATGTSVAVWVSIGAGLIFAGLVLVAVRSHRRNP